MKRPLLVCLLVTACAPPEVRDPVRPAAAAALAAMPLPSEPDSPERALREAVLKSSQAFDLVRSLTDEVGPRLSGSPGSKAAVAWGLRALAAAGFTRVRAEPVTVPHWERGEERAEIVAPHPQPLMLAALGGSVGTPPGGLEAEVVLVESLEAIDRVDPRTIAGKIVFFDVKTERTRDGEGYGRAVPVRGRGASRAARLGAVGVVIRSIGTGDDRVPHTGGMRYDDAVPKIPAAALAIPDAEVLRRLLAAGRPVRLRMTLGCKAHPDAEGANVIGEIEGSGAPGQIVLLGAHLDSWDLGRGAIDDGAGCGIVIEAARQIGRLPRHPRRTVRVVLFANEENGLAGAKAYAAAHADEIPNHVLALEADLGSGRAYEARFLGPAASRPAFEKVARAVAPLGIALSDGEAEGGSDLIPLFSLGVPVMDLRQDASRYFDVHHTANDTLAQVHKEDLDQVAAAFAVAAFAAADSPEGFGRIPEEKRQRP
jgi:hypothetical protein